MIRLYSWNEIGTYDVPAMIDHIIKQIEQEKIFMIQHSQGTTAFFVMANKRPEYQGKLIAAFALASAAFTSHQKNHSNRSSSYLGDNYASKINFNITSNIHYLLRFLITKIFEFCEIISAGAISHNSRF